MEMDIVLGSKCQIWGEKKQQIFFNIFNKFRIQKQRILNKFQQFIHKSYIYFHIHLKYMIQFYLFLFPLFTFTISQNMRTNLISSPFDLSTMSFSNIPIFTNQNNQNPVTNTFIPTTSSQSTISNTNSNSKNILSTPPHTSNSNNPSNSNINLIEIPKNIFGVSSSSNLNTATQVKLNSLKNNDPSNIMNSPSIVINPIILSNIENTKNVVNPTNTKSSLLNPFLNLIKATSFNSGLPCSQYYVQANLQISQNSLNPKKVYYYISFYEVSQLQTPENIGYVGWIDNYTNVNGVIKLGYPNSNLIYQPIFTVLYNKINGNIANLNYSINLDVQWKDLIVTSLNQFSPIKTLFSKYQYKTSNQFQSTVPIFGSIDAKSTSLKSNTKAIKKNIAVIKRELKLQTKHGNLVKNITTANDSSIKSSATQFKKALNNATRVNSLGNRYVSYNNNLNIIAKLNFKLVDQTYPDLEFVQNIFSYLGNNTIQTNNQDNLDNYFSNRLLQNYKPNDYYYISSPPLLINQPIQSVTIISQTTQKTYLIYTRSDQIFLQYLFGHKFQMNYTQNCSLTIFNGNPTNTQNLVICVAQLDNIFAQRINQTVIFIINSTLNNFVGETGLNSNWTFSFPETDIPDNIFSAFLQFSQFQIIIKLNTTLNGIYNKNNIFTINSNFTSQVSITGTQDISLLNQKFNILQFRSRQFDLKSIVNINLQSKNLLGFSYQVFATLNRYNFTDKVGDVVISSVMDMTPLAINLCDLSNTLNY